METVVFISVIAVVILFMVASLIVYSNYSIRVFGFYAGVHLLGSSFWITLSLQEFYHGFVIFLDGVIWRLQATCPIGIRTASETARCSGFNSAVEF